MKEGWWGNYETGKLFDIEEHERWIRSSNHAEQLGIPESLHDRFSRFTPIDDRDKFLLTIMLNASVMRIRGHDNEVTFEFAAADYIKPLNFALNWGTQYAGPMTTMNLVNFIPAENIYLPFADFQSKLAVDGPNAIIKKAKHFKLSHLMRSVIKKATANDPH